MHGIIRPPLKKTFNNLLNLCFDDKIGRYRTVFCIVGIILLRHHLEPTCASIHLNMAKDFCCGGYASSSTSSSASTGRSHTLWLRRSLWSALPKIKTVIGSILPLLEQTRNIFWAVLYYTLRYLWRTGLHLPGGPDRVPMTAKRCILLSCIKNGDVMR